MASGLHELVLADMCGYVVAARLVIGWQFMCRLCPHLVWRFPMNTVCALFVPMGIDCHGLVSGRCGLPPLSSAAYVTECG